MMETSSNFKYLRLLFFPLLSLQIYLLLAVPQDSILVSGHENNIGVDSRVLRKMSLSVNLVDKREIKGVQRGGGDGGGGKGDRGAGGGKTKLFNKRGGALIPVYAAGANRHRHHQQTQSHRRSGSAAVNFVGSGYLVLVLLASFFFVYST